MAASTTETSTKELNQQIGLSTNGSQFLTFNLGDEFYGVDILRVQEIKGYTAVTKIPNTPASIPSFHNTEARIVLPPRQVVPAVGDYAAARIPLVGDSPSINRRSMSSNATSLSPDFPMPLIKLTSILAPNLGGG